MKLKIAYFVRKEELVELPKDFEPLFKKDEDDYTDEDWNLMEKYSNWLNDFGLDPEVNDVFYN